MTGQRPSGPAHSLTGGEALFSPVYRKVVKPRLDAAVTVLRAPRGCGKSELVALMRADLHVPDAQVVDGKLADAAQVVIDEWPALVRAAALDEPILLIVDDADELLRSHPSSTREGAVLRTSLEILISYARAGRARVVLTITRAPESLSEPSAIISDSLRSPAIEPIALPMSAWHDALMEAVGAVVQTGVHVTRDDTRLAEELFALSGGHPALMAAGLDAVAALVSETLSPEIEQRRVTEPDFLLDTIRQAVRWDGRRLIRRQISRLRSEANPTQAEIGRQALDVLRHQLQDALDQPREAPLALFRPPPAVGEALLDAALARHADQRLRGTFVLWGGEFLQIARAALDEPSPVAAPSIAGPADSPSAPQARRALVERRALIGSKRGELRIVGTDGEETFVPLTPQSWLLVNEIINANGSVVSVKELHEAMRQRSVGEVTESATMTAIQRMLQEVGRKSEKPIVNVRGEGYRFRVESYQLKP